ncbi:MAG: bifunctional (p)ppGpp synthetase/guanosine-3',5'-bis(diphosphate) 3'-pyrophosphohydrolase [Ktedonobacteraceae bacterium]
MVERFVEHYASPPNSLEEIERLLTLVRRYMKPTEVKRVIEALHLAQEKCKGVVGTRPIPPLEHALAVSTILAQLMHADAVGVSAGLIFEAVDAELLSLEDVERELGASAARIVGSMSRLNILERRKQSVAGAKAPKTGDERDEAGQNVPVENKKRRVREAMRRQQAETVRKMFIAMADDPRVVLMKLAYRLHAMRLVSKPFYEGDRQDMLTMALETREIYAPLAGRLGMSRVESELEDLAFSVLEPEKYAWVRDEVEEESKQWRSYVEDICTILRAEMKAIGVNAEVSGRVKHLYSFYKKLHRSAGDVENLDEIKKASDISQIHDLIAFRILVDTTQDCYVALGHVHSLWKPKEGRIKDFIANPKPNGYRALHTTIFCKDDHLVEVQIRTHEMHETAEYGVAMHWHYKDVGDNASSSAKELLSWLRQLTEWQREMHASSASDADFVEAVKDDIFQEQIFIFTPHGEVKDLPVGSTPLDFAYRVHTKIGDSCAGARIITNSENGDGDRLVTRMVPLDYELRSGEVVDIVTSRTAHPTRDWLNFVRTAAAKSKIRRYLKIHERHINIQIGRERLDRELKVLGVRGIESISEDAGKWLCEEYRVAEFDDLLAAIGADDVRPHQAAVRVTEHWQLREGKEAKESKEHEETLGLLTTTSKQESSASLEVAGVSGLLTKLANCCCPLPGDEIVGFISRGKGVIVHRADCRNLNRYREREHERLIPVSWLGMSQTHYLAPIVIQARDRSGLIRDIATVMSDVGVNMTSVSTHVSASRGRNREMVIVSATLEVNDMEQMQRLFTRLEKIKDVLHVERDLGKRS